MNGRRPASGFRRPGRRGGWLVAPFFALAGCGETPPADETTSPAVLEGSYVWGAEVNAFTPCSSQSDYWVVGATEVTQELARRYQALELPPYEMVYVRLEGELGPPRTEGFAADYDGTVRVARVLDMGLEAPPLCEDRPAGTERDSVPIHDPATLDTLADASGAAWRLVSGVECTNCDAPETLYLVPDDRTASVLGPFAFPGEYYEMGMDEHPVSRTRAFVGDCHAEPGEELVLLTEQWLGTDTWGGDRAIVVVRPGSGVGYTREAWSDALEQAVQRAVSAGTCRELPGRRQAI